MIKRDKYGIIVDDTGDGGDSANRTGISLLTGVSVEPVPLFFKPSESLLQSAPLSLRRHPTQIPWSNPKNFSRDQLIPFVAGVSKLYGSTVYIAEDIFWANAKRLFFCQNTERDYPGSTKYPWPHTYYDQTDQKTHFKYFDCADILMPGDIWHLILCARLKYLYWFAIIGIPWLILEMVVHCKFDKSDDEGQMISKCIIAGRWAKKLYKWLKPDWKDSLHRYWTTSRNQVEFENALVAVMTNDNM